MPVLKIAFVYARTDSSRLPGKALIPIGGHPLIDIVLARARDLKIDDVALLTTDREVDEPLASHARQSGALVFRGNPFDLVQRTCSAIHYFEVDWCIRINGDCPFFEPELAHLAQQHIDNSVDLISNLFTRRYPYGVAIEWFNAQTYLSLAPSAKIDELEHVTKHFYRLGNQLNALSMVSHQDDSQISLTVDTFDDLNKLQASPLINHLKYIHYWEFKNTPKPPPPQFINLNAKK